MYSDLLERVQSPKFDCSLCIFELSKYGENIGVQHYLVQRLGTYLYSEIEFYIPQLIQVLVSYESDSMALQDFILEFCRKYPHFCLLSFWNLQAYVYELKGQPDSYSFHIVRSFVNSLQDIMFNQNIDGGHQVALRENLHPALMIGAALGASIGLPYIQGYIKPIIISQGKQQKSFLFKLANFHKALTKNLTLKNRGKPLDLGSARDSEENDSGEETLKERYSESMLVNSRRNSRASSTFAIDSDLEEAHYDSDYSDGRAFALKKKAHTRRANVHPFRSKGSWSSDKSSFFCSNNDEILSQSMPDLTKEPNQIEIPHVPINSNVSVESLDIDSPKRLSKSASSDALRKDDSQTLKSNYFRKETEFMMVLQNISSRLSNVPKEARLTSLRAELSIINNALLPSQIDIPQLFPPSSLPNKRYHRILRLNITEACVLNSAERVPYLLLIEYLSEDMDFDPHTEKNKVVLTAKNLKSTFKQGEDSDLSRNSMDSEADGADLGEISVISLSNKKLHFLDHLRANMSNDLNVRSEGLQATRGIPLTKKFPHTHEGPLTSSGKTKDLSAQIRIAAVMLKQLEKSGQASSDQSAAIKLRIIKSMEALQDEFETIDYQRIREISAVHEGNEEQDAGERKIENDFKIGEDWVTKRARIRKASMFGHLPHWDLCSVIVKNGDDLQQEALACQLISVVFHAWKEDKVAVWVKNMKIVITSFGSGLVETINNAISIHSIKKTMTELSIKSGENPKGVVASLKDYFVKVYGNEDSGKYHKAQENFARSLAAYSIICYVLQIKDRHNGNIMLDNEGHIIHIDFGFILSNSPGSVGFEAAPFKLTMEYVDVLGGFGSKFYKLFVHLCKASFNSLRSHCDQLINLVDLMQKDSTLPCFKNKAQTGILLRQRLQLELNAEEVDDFVENNLIAKSVGSMYTRLYDQFQLLTQGIYS